MTLICNQGSLDWISGKISSQALDQNAQGGVAIPGDS